MTSPLLMYSTAILDQVNLFLRRLMRILRFLRTLRRVLRKNTETVVRPILLMVLFLLYLSPQTNDVSALSCHNMLDN